MYTNNNIRILGEDVQVSTNTHETLRNNNILCVAGSGCGKTRGLLHSNLKHVDNESFIVTDTKGSLYGEFAEGLRQRGYRVELIDFTNTSRSTIGYNPLDYLKFDSNGLVKEQSARKLGKLMIIDNYDKEPYWPESARNYITMVLLFIANRLCEEDRNIVSVNAMLHEINSDVGRSAFQKLADEYPMSLFSSLFKEVLSTSVSDRTFSSILSFAYNAMDNFAFDEADLLYKNPNRIRFEDLGKSKTALFLNISDHDKSMYALANIFYSQALSALLDSADNNPNYRLDVPTHIWLDDFASNVVIEDFERIISIIRSRDLSVGVICQSLDQLNAMYGDNKANIICDNCDTFIYMGGCSRSTTSLISERYNKPVEEIMNLGNDDELIFIRGSKPVKAKKYRPENHIHDVDTEV